MSESVVVFIKNTELYHNNCTVIDTFLYYFSTTGGGEISL